MMTPANRQALSRMLGTMLNKQPFILLVLGNDPTPEDPRGTRIEVVSNMADMAMVKGILREAGEGVEVEGPTEHFKKPKPPRPENN